MEQRELNIQLRPRTGKGISGRLRLQGLVPAVVYGKGIDPVAVAVDAKALAAAIAGEGGRNNLITLKGNSALDGTVVIVADLMRDPLKGSPQHVDLHKISLTEKLHVDVKITIVGTAKGVKDGGLLDLAMHTVKVECLPTQIPEHIDVDVTGLAIGHSIHVSELVIPPGVKVLDDPKAPVVSVLGRGKEEVPAGAAAE